MQTSQDSVAELFHSWKEHPVTKLVFKGLQQRVDERKEAWMNGGFHDMNSNTMIVKNAREQGYALACQDILNTSAEELEDAE